MEYLLIDLERSIGSGIVHYWRGNSWGYTTDIREAGHFSAKETRAVIEGDFNHYTKAIEAEAALKLAGLALDYKH